HPPDHPLAHDRVPDPIEGPRTDGVAVVLRLGERHVDELVANRFGGRAGTPAGSLGEEGVPSHAIEVLDDTTNPALAPPHHGGDLRGRKSLVGVEQYLSSTNHGRIASSIHQARDRLAFLGGEVPDAEHGKGAWRSPGKYLRRTGQETLHEVSGRGTRLL